MANVYDLSSRLTNDRPVIKIDKEHQYEVDNTMTAFTDIMDGIMDSEGPLQAYPKVIKRILGDEAAAEIDAMNLSYQDYQEVYFATVAASEGLEIDEIKARFQDWAKTLK